MPGAYDKRGSPQIGEPLFMFSSSYGFILIVYSIGNNEHDTGNNEYR